MNDTEFAWPSEQIIIVDVEGNGHTPPDLVELAIAAFPAIKDEAPLSWLIKPANRITWQAKNIHGIGNSDVENCPGWYDIKSDVEQELTGKWFVAHNALVDYSVVKRHLPDWVPAGIIDTLRFARHVYPNAKSHSLAALLTTTGLRDEVSGELHRAGEDARVTALLLAHLVEKSSAKNWIEICKIAQIQKPTEEKAPPPEQGSLW